MEDIPLSPQDIKKQNKTSFNRWTQPLIFLPLFQDN
jgi:hypothetical protein